MSDSQRGNTIARPLYRLKHLSHMAKAFRLAGVQAGFPPSSPNRRNPVTQQGDWKPGLTWRRNLAEVQTSEVISGLWLTAMSTALAYLSMPSTILSNRSRRKTSSPALFLYVHFCLSLSFRASSASLRA